MLLAAENLNLFDPASPPTEWIRYLFLLVLAVSAGIFLLVEGVLLYSLLRFRRPAVERTEPPQVYGSLPIEIAWTAGPTLIVFLLILVVARTEYEVRANPPEPRDGDNALFVTVIGHQWWWEYRYDHWNGKPIRAVGADGEETDQPVITANELHVPASEPGTARKVYLTLKSADVAHSFWVPRLAGKTDLIPGKTNTMWFESDKPGLYLGQCAEYCGTQHAHMLLRVYVDSPGEFQRWLDNERKPAVDAPEVREGRDAFLAQSCINCHRVRGTLAAGTYAPDLTHLMSRQTFASGIVPNTRPDLLEWVNDPQKIKVGCLMPAFKLSARELNLVVDYLVSLR
jgi:cytochrome c oxidase subunit 2